jgi:hypothetical protein
MTRLRQEAAYQDQRLRLEAETARDRIRRANERFEIAEAAAGGFVYDYNAETGEVERSGGLERVLGYREGEIPLIRGWWQLKIGRKRLMLFLSQRNTPNIESTEYHQMAQESTPLCAAPIGLCV